jgi:hypothetical protein
MTNKKESGADPELKKLLQVYLTIVGAGCFLSIDRSQPSKV